MKLKNLRIVLRGHKLKILVVGGAGYIGSHFVLEASKKGNE